MITLKDEFRKKDVLLGFCLMYPTVGIIERIGSDWDWIWIDAQHGQHDNGSILECVRACERAGVPSVVRVPHNDYGVIGRVLDTCTSGVMVPMVDSAAQARAAVEAAKFPPLGRRSFGGRRPIDLYGRSYSHHANINTMMIAQIETEEGLRNVTEIASVPGIDALFFGPDDLAIQLAMPMDQPRETDFFKEAMEKTAKAAKAYGKILGTVTATPEMLQLTMEMGYRLCVGTADAAMLAEGSSNKRKALSTVANF